MRKKKSPSSGLSELPKTELVRTYVWEKPVRIAHWLMFFAFISLSVTGIYLHHPFLAPSGRLSFLMAKMRFIHVVSGWVLIAAMALRVYWFFKGNFWARWPAYVPIHRRQWQGIGEMLEFYLFLRFDPGRRVGHNPLAALSYFVIYVLIGVEIITGLALYSQVLGNPVLHQFLGWMPRVINPGYLHLIHYFLMFIFFAFIIFHVYASVLVSQTEQNGLLDSIFSGWKIVPAGELRHEVAQIPEARSFARKHDLLPRGTAEGQKTGARPGVRPSPGPAILYRNWISYGGTGIAAIGVIVFAVLTAYHTIGGGALIHPYGDLVIAFVPPLFVVMGVAVVLLGMYIQWLRWRMHKPLSFGRYPKWDLNLAADRKALLFSVMGVAIIAIPAIYGAGQAYLYTGATGFCGGTCHSMTPEFTTYKLSPHANLECSQCHVGPGPTAYVTSKMRGMVELYHEVKNDYRRPIPAPVKSLHAIQVDCEQCHWSGNSFGVKEVRRVHFLADEQNTRWEVGMSVPIGGGPDGTASGVHWHVANKVEYVAGDPERQNITWVRAIDPKTGTAKVYTSGGQSFTAAPQGEMRRMECVDCHNRPTHILLAPDQSLDAALADGRLDASLPFIKQQGVAALSATYASQEQAMQGIENAVRGYYQKRYPQVYAGKQPTVEAAITYLKQTYANYFFPAMKVRWDTYASNDGHLYSTGCFRCHDGQHKSVEGSIIRSDCNACHTILRQGKAGNLQFASSPKGLTFEHPMDVGGAETTQACNSCHTGGAM